MKNEVLRGLAVACWTILVVSGVAPTHAQGAAASVLAPRATGATIAEQTMGRRVAAMQHRVDAGYRKATKFFAGPLPAKEAESALARMKGEWDQRIARCASDRCKISLLDDFDNRIRFALGQPAKAIAGVPWTQNEFSVEASDMAGSLYIFPVIDDRLVIWIDTVASPDGRWICDLSAEGRLAGGASAVMTTLDEDKASFRLRARRGAIVLRPMSRNAPPACDVGEILATYHAERVRRPVR